MAIRRYNATSGQWEQFGSPQLNPASLGITPASIGAVAVNNGTVTTANTGQAAVRNTFVSTNAPTSGQGNDGDIWVQYI
jgi:hypothetical protein